MIIMAGLFGNIGRAFSDSISEASTQTTVENQRQGELSKLEAQLRDIDLKLKNNYTLLGQETANLIRKDQEVDINSIASFFKPIQSLDTERQQILEAIKEVKSQQADQLNAQELIRTKKEVEAETLKLEELKNLGVLDEEEWEVSQAKLRKRVDNFEKVYSLKIAFDRGLINKEEYTKRKAILE